MAKTTVQSAKDSLFSHSCFNQLLGLSNTSNYNWDCASLKKNPAAVEDPDVGKIRTIAHEAIGVRS